jgi:ATP-dependent Clp protease ATP-binding subunit ClpA
MDHGTLTDTNGRSSDFRHIIVVMTSNAGAADAQRTSIGFSKQKNSSDLMGAIKHYFTPEFRNRLDAIINFAPLDLATIGLIVDKFIMELDEQLSHKGVT